MKKIMKDRSQLNSGNNAIISGRPKSSGAVSSGAE